MIIALKVDHGIDKTLFTNILQEKYGLFSIVSLQENTISLCSKAFELSYRQLTQKDLLHKDLDNSIFLNNLHIQEIINWVIRENKYILKKEEINMLRTLGREDHILKTPQMALDFINFIFKEYIGERFIVNNAIKNIKDKISNKVNISYCRTHIIITDIYTTAEMRTLNTFLPTKKVLLRNISIKTLVEKKFLQEDTKDITHYDHILRYDKSKEKDFIAKVNAFSTKYLDSEVKYVTSNPII